VTISSSKAEPAAPAVGPPRPLGDAKQLGARLSCSWRHVLRMADRGLIPWGLKLGSLRRWDMEEIEEWIASGCKPCQSTKPGRPAPRKR
jgi:predicted DNA-binding transcriptional regulator AlpA